jgi:hypothetical protein
MVSIVDLPTPLQAPLLGYHVYTSLDKSENPRNPPKSPLKRGTKIQILAPFLRGLGDSDLKTKSIGLVYTRYLPGRGFFLKPKA